MRPQGGSCITPKEVLGDLALNVRDIAPVFVGSFHPALVFRPLFGGFRPLFVGFIHSALVFRKASVELFTRLFEPFFRCFQALIELFTRLFEPFFRCLQALIELFTRVGQLIGQAIELFFKRCGHTLNKILSVRMHDNADY